MTYKERYLKEHPECGPCELKFVTNSYCPEDVMNVNSVNCELNKDRPDPCDYCWNSEIPEEIVDKLCEVGTVNPITPSEVRKILDSGERRQFDTGAVRDIQEGKGRCDLMPLDVLSWYLLEDEVLGHIFLYQEYGDEHRLIQALGYFLSEASSWVRPETMFLELSKHFEEGAKKYGENNWQKGIPTHCYIDSAVRHYLKYLRGDKDEPHDRAFVWNIVCCIWTCVHKPELNDYKKKDGETNE